VKIAASKGDTPPRRRNARPTSGKTLKALMPAVVTTLAIAYPVTAHWAVVSHSSTVTIASLAVLASLALLPRLVARSVFAWIALPVVIVALALLGREHIAWLPLYATPVCVNLFGAWIFGHTLAAGQTPLIERLARLLHEPDGISDEIAKYARKVTAAWALFLFSLAMLNLTLALLAAPGGVLLMMGVTPPVTVRVETWSLFANFLNYAMAGLFFIGEYIYRQRKFPDQPYRNIFDFLQRARRVGPRVMMGQRPGRERA
jgi:uncharacterized membrane protein